MITELFLIAATFAKAPIQPWWDWACENASEYNMFVFGCLLSQIIGYFFGCLPYIIMDVMRPFRSASFKIQQTYPSKYEMLVTSKDMMVSFLLVVFPMLALGGFVLPQLGISRDGPLPPWYVVLVQIAYFFLVEDFFNYWVHRWLHQPFLYKHVHSVHHKYNSPFSIAAAYAHPLEVLMQAIPTFLGPLLISPHLYTLMIWQIVRNFEAIDIHSGYELPLSLKTFFPAYAGTRHHDYHHYAHSGNFASVFTWCDRLYGTHLGYETYLTKNRQVSSAGGACAIVDG